MARLQGEDGAAALEPFAAGAGEADGDPPQPSSPCRPEEAGISQYEGPVGCKAPPDPEGCIEDPNGPMGLNPNSFLPNQNSVGLLYARTEQEPEDLNASPPVECTKTPVEDCDFAHARAGVANIFLTSGGPVTEPQPNSLHISAANAFATVKCVADDDGTGLEPIMEGRSQVVYVRLGAEAAIDIIPGILPPGETGPEEGGGDPPAGTNQHDHFDLGDARVHFNHSHRDTFVDAEGDVHQRLTQQAVVLQQDHTADPNDPEFDPNANQSAIVLAEAVVDFEGNPCEVEQGQVTVVKEVEPGTDPQDFRFRLRCEAQDPEDEDNNNGDENGNNNGDENGDDDNNDEDELCDERFELDDDGNDAGEGRGRRNRDDEDLPKSRTFTVPAPSNVRIRERQEEGFETSAECRDDETGEVVEDQDDDPNRVRFDLAPDQKVTCTFTNRKDQAQVKVVKDTQPDDRQDFEFRLRCEGDEDNDDSNEEDNNNNENGENENGRDDDEDDERCDERFELDDDGQPGEGEGNRDEDDADLPNSRTFTVPAGEIRIREREVDGFTTTAECKDDETGQVLADEDPDPTRVRFQIAAGQEVTCTFTNVRDEDEGRVNVVKDTDPNSDQLFDFEFRHDPDDEGERTEAEFQLQDNGNENDGQRSSRAFENLAPGEVRVEEDEVDGFTTTSECKDDASGQVLTDEDGDPAKVKFQLGEDQQVTCTFRNVEVDEDEGRVNVVKDTDPNSDQLFDFEFRHDPDDEGERTEAEFQLQDNGNENDGQRSSRAFENLAPGEVRVEEDEVDGFTTTSECKDDASGQVLTDEDGDPAKVKFQLGEDQQVTCTFTNRAEPEAGTVTVRKDTDPNDPQDFNFEIDRTQGQGSFQEEFVLDDDNDPAHPNQMTFTPGTGRVRIEEEGEDDDGFDLASIDCEPDQGEDVDIDEDGDGGRVEFDLAAGENVTCTFRNVPADEEEPEEPEEPAPGTGTIEIRKDIVDADKDGSPVFHFVGDLGEFDLSENDESGVPDRMEFENIAAGQYEVTEEDDPEDGFELFRIRCQGDEDGGTPEQQGPAFGGDNTARIDLDPGEDIRCRFLNTTDGNDPGNSGPGNADPEDDDDDNSGSGSGGGGGNSGPGRLASRAF